MYLFDLQADILRRWSVIYCLSNWPTEVIVFTLKNHFLRLESESDELHDFRDAVSEMAWSLVVHSTTRLRCFAGTILCLLAESSGNELLALLSINMLKTLNCST